MDLFSRRGLADEAHACAEALTRIAADTGHADAVAALAHAIGEAALASGEAETVADQLGQAAELHRGLDLPFERAEIELRAGVALAAAGEREPALERIADVYRAARKLGARPLAAEAAGKVATLGESVAQAAHVAGERGLLASWSRTSIACRPSSPTTWPPASASAAGGRSGPARWSGSRSTSGPGAACPTRASTTKPPPP